jgi:hypothetical protein
MATKHRNEERNEWIYIAMIKKLVHMFRLIPLSATLLIYIHFFVFFMSFLEFHFHFILCQQVHPLSQLQSLAVLDLQCPIPCRRTTAKCLGTALRNLLQSSLRVVYLCSVNLRDQLWYMSCCTCTSVERGNRYLRDVSACRTRTCASINS